VDRSYDLYDNSPNDPTSAAQAAAQTWALQNIPSAHVAAPEASRTASVPAATPMKEKPFSLLSRLADAENTPKSSAANSPAPEGTPRPGSPSGEGKDSAPVNGTGNDPVAERIKIAEESDRILPVMPLDEAILTSIRQAARGDDRKMKDFLGGVMVVGGGAKIPGFNAFLEERLRAVLPHLNKEIMVAEPPRELDLQLVSWKGGSVFGRLSTSGNDSWVYQREYELLGYKLLAQKLMFAY